MDKEIKISIVTPTYNSKEYMENCINSIKSQSYKNYEHIIIDGGSTDGTLDIIKKYEGSYPMKWISEPDRGMYDAINKGFNMADGDIFAWLNSDDFYFPWTLQVVAKVFNNRTDVEWLTGIPSNTRQYEKSDITYQLPNLATVYCTPLIRKGMYDGNNMYHIQQESCFWSRKIWEQTGINSDAYKLAGDYHLWKEFAEKTVLYTVNCNLASFRIHANQKSENIEEYNKEVNHPTKLLFIRILLQIYCQLYSLINYRKYVINLNDLYTK